MRLALCLSGQPRTWRWTRESLLAFFAGHELDVFIHTWREGDPDELEALIAAYRPRACRIEERPLFLAEKRLLAERFPTRPVLTMFDMFHSTAGSLALAASEGEGYDLVVRARFDAMFDGTWSGEVPPAGAVIAPNSDPDPTGCNDQFALGRPAEMQAYGAAGAWLRDALPESSGEWLRPERVLRHFLEKVCGFELRLRPMAMRLCRDAQAGLPFAGLSDDPLFHAAKHEDWQAFALDHFPELAGRIDFAHPSRMPLMLDRALGAWAAAHPGEAAHELFEAPWPRRIAAIDSFLDAQTGGLRDLDEDAYCSVRLICAALLQRMCREPLNRQSAIVHMLSDNIRDMRRVHAWTQASPGRLEQAMNAAPADGLLACALAYKPPLTAFGHDIWRRPPSPAN